MAGFFSIDGGEGGGFSGSSGGGGACQCPLFRVCVVGGTAAYGDSNGCG